jgi:hypothetical protein
MKKWMLRTLAIGLLTTFGFGQATPISSTPDQPQAAPAPQKSTHVRRAKAHHAKAHHASHRKHHKAA